jgi:hypothetical protein
VEEENLEGDRGLAVDNHVQCSALSQPVTLYLEKYAAVPPVNWSGEGPDCQCLCQDWSDSSCLSFSLD